MVENNKIDYVGKIFDSKNCGKFKVLREMIGIGYYKGNRVFEIEFLETGYRKVVTSVAFRTGEVKDRLIKTIAGVGYMGYIDDIEDPNMHGFYKIWASMIERCYDPDNVAFHNYGGSGVKVSEDWHCFANFYRDIRFIYGYENKLKYPKMYHLDKDYLQSNIPKSQRIYSTNTCLWISTYENLLVSGRDNNVSKTGYFGVIIDSGYYYTRIYDIYYGRFKFPEHAACMFNYIYPIVRNKEFTSLPMINNVPMIPFEELEKQNLLIKRNNLDELLSNNNIISSTTICEDRVDFKVKSEW